MTNNHLINNGEWLKDLFLGHSLIFLCGGLFQLFLFSFMSSWEHFICLLYGYAAAACAFLFLWEYRRHCLKHHDHWILRTGWWDLLLVLGTPFAGYCWGVYSLREFSQDVVLAGILIFLSLIVQCQGILRIDRRLTDTFIARLKRIRGAEAAYRASGVNYRAWCLTFAWIMLAMLLYNGGGDYGMITWTTHVMRLVFLAFALCVASCVEWQILRKKYWQRSELTIGTKKRGALSHLGHCLGMLPWCFWASIPVLLLEVASAVVLSREGWYVTVMLAFSYQLLLCNFFHLSSGKPSRLWNWLVVHPVYLLVVSLFCLVLIGTYLFELPFCYLPVTALVEEQNALPEAMALLEVAGQRSEAVTSLEPMPLVDAFFTAASAVSVTGMTTIEVARFPFWGRVVLCCLVQLGALGVMTVSSFFAVLAGQRLGLMGNSLVNRVAGEDRGLLAKQMIRTVIIVTLWLEILGTAVFSTYLRQNHAMSASDALGHGFFLALNSFCNAGFQIYPGGFTVSGLNEVVPMLMSAVLFILGGLGFGVLMGIWRWLFHDRVHPQTPQVRIVLVMTAVLIGVGTLIFLCSEWNNPATLGEMTLPKKLLNAFFAAASSRTAGYEALPLTALRGPAAFFTRVLIFIGGAPGSTGGGVRVTTIGVLLLLVWSIIKRRQDVVIGKASISDATVRQAIAVLCLALLVASLGTLVLTFVTMGSEVTFGQLSFEVVSAMSTVGMSQGIIPQMNALGKIVLIVIMFMGRIGFLSILSVASGNVSAPKVRYPEWRVMIG